MAIGGLSLCMTLQSDRMPPSSERVAHFMEYFAEPCRSEPLGKVACTLAIATAHHRLNYIHPFPAGNGRVSRLMSHAMAHKASIGAHGPMVGFARTCSRP